MEIGFPDTDSDAHATPESCFRTMPSPTEAKNVMEGLVENNAVELKDKPFYVFLLVL